MNEIEEQADRSAEEAPARPGHRWLRVVPVVLLVAVTAGSLAYAAQQRSDATDAQGRDARRRDAVLVASGFVEALISYDYEDLDTQQTAVERFVTDDFRADYADAFTNDVREQIVAEKARSTVTVQDVWLSTDDGDEASAVVHARSKIESEGGASADLESYLRVRLVRLGDEWRVDDLTSLGSRDLSAPLTAPDTAAGGSEGEGDGDG